MSVDIFDTDTPAAVPSTAPGAAFYVDDPNPASQADFDRFLGKPVIRITRTHLVRQADAIDTENGAATPALAAQWVRMKNDAGDAVALVYASLSAWPALDTALKGLRYQRWVAHWTGKSHTEAGAAIVQWANSTMTGHHYDQSTCFDMALAKQLTHNPPKPAPKPLVLLQQAQAALATASADIAQAIKALGG